MGIATEDEGSQAAVARLLEELRALNEDLKVPTPRAWGIDARRYEELLRPHVTRSQEIPGGGISGFLPQSRAAIRMRDASMRAMTSRPLRGLATRLFFSKADGIDLPEYAAAR